MKVFERITDNISKGENKMKFINRLQNENEKLKKQIQAYEDGLTAIMAYLNSEKFQGIENNFVNPSDIFLRINEMKQKVTDIEFE